MGTWRGRVRRRRHRGDDHLPREYSEEEQTRIEGETSMSYWPFGSFHASSGYSSDVSFDEGTMTVTMSVAKGNPQSRA